MSRQKPSQQVQAISIGLSERDIVVLVLEKHGAEQRVRSIRKTWRKAARDLGSDAGKIELRDAVAELANEIHLQGVPLHLALSSDFCVTRVVSGENEAVQREVQELCERSRVYLSLGVGEKTYAITESIIDPRRKHVWVSVANLQVIQNIFEAFHEAKLSIVRVEHSLSAISRVAHAVRADVNQPVLVIDVSQRVVDVGISFNGQLLLDYRPSGTNAKESAGIIVARHTKRLQRYLDRLLKRESAPIQSINLCGDVPDIEDVRLKLAEKTGMTVQLLDASMAVDQWILDDEVAHDHRVCSAFGLLLAQFDRSSKQVYPNLLDPFIEASRGPMLRRLLKLTWPVLTTVAASLLIYAGALQQQWEANSHESEMAALDDEANRFASTQRELMGIDTRLNHLRVIQTKLTKSDWNQLVTRVGQSLPRGVWMQGIQADRIGDVTISGTSHTQDGVFEFMRHLRSVPTLNSVALESTSQTILSTGPAVQFTVKAVSRSSSAPNGEKTAARSGESLK